MINSVGCAACRPTFQEALLAALGDDLPKLCEDCQRRAKTNPLRIYDCKVEADQPIIDRLPHSVDYLCEACATHFAGVKAPARRLGHPVADFAPARARTRLLHAHDVRGARRGARRAERDARRRPLRRSGEAAGRSGSHRDRFRRRPRAAGPGAAGRRGGSPRRRGRSSSRSATTAGPRRCGCCASCDRPACRRRWSSRRAA